MTERSPAKIKRADEAKAPRKTASGAVEASEVARLKVELATAHARIAELEKRQSDVINRIDWVIDSLHNFGEKS
ncbi:MAG: hypothetical protein ACT4OU_04100 [Hyphomicrobium sp.]